MEISIIILAFNQKKCTENCIKSIKQNSAFENELILVDNGSNDNTYDLKNFVDIYIKLETNVGFAKGMNVGLRKATKDFVIFLNNDTKVPNKWDEKLLNSFLSLSSKKIGLMIACYTSGKHAGLRKYVTNKIIKLKKFDFRQKNMPAAVCFMLNTKFMRQINGWSEEYGIGGYEDDDLICKVWDNKSEVYLNESVLIKHYGSQTINMIGGYKLDKPKNIFYDKWSKKEKLIIRILRHVRKMSSPIFLFLRNH